MKRPAKITWEFRKLTFVLNVAFLATFLGVALGTALDVNAAQSIYDMDRLLNEPHPFATPQVRPRPQTQRPVPVTPTPQSKDQDDGLDLDDLGPGVEAAVEDVNDPIESFNRVIFGFNEILAKHLIGPLARGYNAAVPDAAREAIRNFLSNLNGPVILANNLLQGELKRGYATTMRLLINSTAGILGFIDVAKNFGFEEHNEDFGQTLAVWGVGEGLYLVLPVFGPSNPRDALGKLLVDPFFDPLGYYLDNTDREEIGYTILGVRGFTRFAAFVDQIDELRHSSLDFYGAMRSLYRQRRNLEIKNGGLDDLPNIDPILDKRSVPPSLPNP
tara:strand:- start:1562 stop:2551 length:990 start_codon:yes stop_codon:yes gene_type:complete